MDPNTRALIMGAGGGAAAEKIYVEDVFSTWLYTGNESTQTITNGIDLSGKGGMVWFKNRANTNGHALHDTERGTNKQLDSSNTDGQTTIGAGHDLTSFNSNGFTIAGNWLNKVNASSYTYSSWTFREQAKFFDVVTWTGSGANRTIAHSLGSVPGCIIVKRTDTTGAWQVYHRSLANTEYLVLNSTAAKATGATRWNSTTPTSTEFSLGTDATVNANGGTYVAYLFAHDAGGFGDSGNESAVSCGLMTNAAPVNLGWEPQFVLLKRTDSTGSWLLLDTMRGFDSSTTSTALFANLSDAEASAGYGWSLNATGFSGQAAGTYIYIAIRRGPMKTPTDATTLFNTVAATNSNPWWKPGFVVDWGIGFSKTTADKYFTGTRLLGNGVLGTDNLYTNQTAAASTNSRNKFDYQNGWYANILANSDFMSWSFRRAPGFFDVVAYTGNDTTQAVTHNLAVTPELVIVKSRSATGSWRTLSTSLAKYTNLNDTTAFTDASIANVFGNNTTYVAPTSSSFTVGNDDVVNNTATTYVAYLFATCPGVSKCFSYTGNGTSQTINCGFTSGSRFVLIKRTDSTGDWLVADTARGIVSGNDPLLYLNSTAAEITTLDWLDPDSSGFIVNQEATANANVNGATYIGLAIA